ncbi:MAG: hypothetical protein AMJ43_10035 [Coxiella sp. DG_40]|nr:MAG: hypothetical protein AMJ43_10035 [Coxiella sp. DG_40]
MPKKTSTLKDQLDSEVFEAIFKISGQDCQRVLSCLDKVRKGFDFIDKQALEIAGSLNEDAFLERLRNNENIFTDHKPAEESIFVYFDLSTSVELLNYIIKIRQVASEILGSNQRIRFSDLKLQHSTAFIEMIGNELAINDILLENVKAKYDSLLQEFRPFNLVIKGPHIAATGGIILEGSVYSEQLFKLREIAKKDNRNIPQGAVRGIHEIIHSTIGYVTKATLNQMMRLYQAFESMRTKRTDIPVRVREARIIATKNKKLINNALKISFNGIGKQKLKDDNIVTVLKRINKLAPTWTRNAVTMNFVWEEAMYWSEYGTHSQTLHEAQEILAKCKFMG